MSFLMMKSPSAVDIAARFDRSEDAGAALARVFGDGVRPLRIESALFDAVLEGWRRAQGGRHLTDATKRTREAIVRRFREGVGSDSYTAWQATISEAQIRLLCRRA
jgi:hypothetical protein